MANTLLDVIRTHQEAIFAQGIEQARQIGPHYTTVPEDALRRSFEAILEALKSYLPGLFADLQKLQPFMDPCELDGGIAGIYPDLESISIDYGVMEKASNVLMLPADFGWNDLGTWASMAQIWPKDDQHNVYQGDIMAQDSQGNVVYSRRKLCVLLGVDDLIVVDTDDALLVCPIGRAQDVGRILEVMRQKGMEEYL